MLVAARIAPVGMLLLSIGAMEARCQTLLGQIELVALPNDRMGQSVAPLGDVDGDGCTDLVLGGTGLWDSTSNQCRVWSGQALSLLGTIPKLATPFASQFGAALAGPGDIDGDGVPDVLVGAPGGMDCGFGVCEGTLHGTASVHAGGTWVPLHVWQGLTPGDYSGTAVAGVGDVDGDGVPDLVVGAPQRTIEPTEVFGAGLVQLFSGATGSVLHTWTGAAVGDGFGWSVAGPGDVDGDGVRDVVIGAPWATGSAPGSGWVGLHSGSDGALLRSWNGAASGDEFGRVAASGDVDGDGLPDVLVGAPRQDGAAGADAGQVHAYAGRSGAELLAIEGPEAGTGLGASVAGVGDIDDDGHDELLAGAAIATAEAKQRALLCSGRGGAVIYDIHAPIPASNGDLYAPLFDLGRALASAGDVNADGTPDFVLSGPAEIKVMGDLIKITGGQHLFTFSGLPLSFTSLAQPGAAGAAGQPLLHASGDTLPDAQVVLQISAAAPLHPVLLVVGLGINPKGYKIHTDPWVLNIWAQFDAVLPLGPSDAAGEVSVSGRWPAGLGFGAVLVAQALVADAAAPHGLAASNTLQLTGK